MKKLLAAIAAIFCAASSTPAGELASDPAVLSGSYQFLSLGVPTLFYGIVVPQPFILGVIPTESTRPVALKKVLIDGEVYYQYPNGSLSLAPGGTVYSPAPVIIEQPLPWYIGSWDPWWSWNVPPPPPRRPGPHRPPRPRPPEPPKPEVQKPSRPAGQVKPATPAGRPLPLRPLGQAVTPRPSPRDDRYRPSDFVRAGQTYRPGDAFRPGDGYKPSDNFNSRNTPGAGPRPGDGYKPSNSFRPGGFRPGDGYRPSSIYRRNR